MWNCLEFCCMLYKNRISWNLCCHFRWQTIFLCFYCNIYEMKPDIFEIFRTFSRYLEKNREFLEIYLGDFSWYLYLGLRHHWFPHEIKSEKRAQKSVWVWVVWKVPCGKFASTNQKHYPDLGSDASQCGISALGKPVMASFLLMSVVFLTLPYDVMSKALQP